MGEEIASTQSSEESILVSVSFNESSLLNIIRSRKYSKVEIEMRSGEINQVYVDEEISKDARLEEILKANAFQTVTVTRHQGSVVRIRRRIPMKLGSEL